MFDWSPVSYSIIIIIIDYSHMPIRHKKEKEKGDI